MREIKFRVWDKGKKAMQYYADFVEFCGQYYGYGTSVFEPLQYTGLKDKNDREIYEGDIVSTWYDETEVVEWGVGGWLPFINTIGWPDYWEENQPYVEVLGNIYENKELLNAPTA